jgi:predicted RNA binding protein YcfA (HicA-like mRNA interferase family)
MNRKKLEKLRREIEQRRASPQKATAIERLARKLGRRKVKRGSEPTWESDLPGVYPMGIPHHGNKDLAPGTRNNILNQLEEQDLAAWEAKLSSNGHDGHNGSEDDDD